MPAELLIKSLDQELDGKFFATLVRPGKASFDQAEVKFLEGRTANQNGDRFGLAGVLFTTALFFGGIALVIRSQARWAFLAGGLIAWAVATVFMLALPGAGTGLGDFARSGSAAAE